MDYPTRVVSIDWISRLLAFISILASAFAIAVHFSAKDETTASSNVAKAVDEAVNKILSERDFIDSADLKTELTALLGEANSSDTVSETIKEQIRLAVADEINKRDDLITKVDLQTSLEDFQKDAKGVVKYWESSLNDLFVSANREFDRLKAEGDVALKTNLDDKGEPTPAKTAVGGAETSIARVSMKPVSLSERLVRIVNDGDRTVRIRQISFSPEREYQKEYAALKVSADVKTLVFKPKHNKATEKGFHATYRMPLDEPIVILADESVDLQCKIENAAHEKFGFIGSLEVEYDDGESQTAQDVRVDFIK